MRASPVSPSGGRRPPEPELPAIASAPRRVVTRPAEPAPAIAPTGAASLEAAATPVSVASVLAGPAPVPAASPAVTRGSYYLPGRTATWTSFDVTFSAPLAIRAGGRVEAAADVSGPAGVKTSDFERGLNPGRGASQRVLPSAAYLALIGRICSNSTCTEPFVVGANAVLCPSDLKITGTLQLWTNNYVLVGGVRTSLNYSSASGGYSFYVEPAPDRLCANGAALPAGPGSSIDARALEAGQTLRNPEFVISSSQSSWKPFFVPLSSPLLLRASGSMRPRGSVEATGPRGILVPSNAASWSYPGTRDLVVDATHRLYDPSLPYQGLIGRLCGTDACDSPFLVGTEHVICPTPPFTDRIELWTNHIIGPAGLLGTQTPLTLDALELQQRSGSYRFEISRSPAGACAG